MSRRNRRFFNIGCGIILAAVIIWFGFYVNRAIVIKGLYMDDLYMWSCYGEQNLLEFAFPIGTSTRFRPVYWLATYLQMAVIGTHIDRFVTFNIVVNVLTALELAYFAGKLAGGSLFRDARHGERGGADSEEAAGSFVIAKLAALLTALCYLASRFAYYQIGQALGLMETMALAMSTAILYLLIRFSRSRSALVEIRRISFRRDHAGDTGEKGTLRYFYGALLLYFLLAFTHERYICLLPLFYLALLIRSRFADEGSRMSFFREKETLLSWAMPVIVLAVIIGIRTFAIGKALPAGTGGTEVTDTFQVRQMITFAIQQIYYIFGLNAGPDYLCGLPWEETPLLIQRLVKLSAGFILLLTLGFLVTMVCEAVETARRKDLVEACGKRFWDNFSACFMFGGFIALCVGASSVTIRLEMRWIYASYAAALLFASYMLGAVYEELTVRGTAAFFRAGLTALMCGCFTVYAALSIGTNCYYRGFYYRLYFWPDQLRMNSLAEQTVEKYGTGGVFGKNIYILENTYEMSDFYGRTFFKTFDPEKKAEGTTVIFVQDVTQIPAEEIREHRALVLKEVPEDNAYLDITAELR